MEKCAPTLNIALDASQEEVEKIVLENEVSTKMAGRQST